MSVDPIGPDLRAFIARYIDSVAQLEALLLLRNNPGETWTASAIAARLYTSETETNFILERLHRDGLLGRNGHAYRYECAVELQVTVDRLAEAYRLQLVGITNLIHAKPRRIREFADAFKLKKDT